MLDSKGMKELEEIDEKISNIEKKNAKIKLEIEQLEEKKK